MGRIAICLLALDLAGPAGAQVINTQVINGQSTDDAAFAPRPAARWHSPEARGAVPDTQAPDDARDQGVRSEPRRD